MKKLLLSTLIAWSAQTWAAVAEPHHDILANEGDFTVISDLQSSEITVFLSYTGIRFDHCGITLRGSNIAPDKLRQLLNIQVGTEPTLAKVVGRQVQIAVKNPNNTTYGQFFIIQTKTGESFSETFKKIDSHGQSNGKVDVIAEILSCKK